MRLVHTLVPPLLALSLACDGDPAGPKNGGPAVDCSAEVTEVAAEISIGENVVFDWSPRCRVAMLGVEGDGGDRWWIGSEESNEIEPPVTYGVTPEGVEPEDALPLVEGETYELILWIIGDEGEYLAEVAEFER